MSDIGNRNKRFSTLGWIFLLVGLVVNVDGMLQLIAGNTDRLGQASLGALLMLFSSLFFVLRRREPKLKTPGAA